MNLLTCTKPTSLRISASLIFIASVFFLALPQSAPAQTVNIPDAALRAAISKEIGGYITRAKLASLEILTVSDSGIRNLTGLELATNLTWLNLSSNQISDISALRQLRKLEWLWLEDNRISDVSPLKNMVKLEWLSLQNNPVSNIASLRRLPKLKHLYHD